MAFPSHLKFYPYPMKTDWGPRRLGRVLQLNVQGGLLFDLRLDLLRIWAAPADARTSFVEMRAVSAGRDIVLGWVHTADLANFLRDAQVPIRNYYQVAFPAYAWLLDLAVGKRWTFDGFKPAKFPWTIQIFRAGDVTLTEI